MITPLPFPAEVDRRALIRDPRWVFDFVLCLGFQGFAALPFIFGYEVGNQVDSLATAGLSFALAATVLIRRQLPRFAVLAAAGISLAMAITVGEPVPVIVVVPVVVYSAARWIDQRWGRIAFGLALVGSVIGPSRWVLPYGLALDRLPLLTVTGFACAAITGGAYLLGRRRSEWVENARQRTQGELERQRLLLAEQAQRDRAAAVTERQRIARELHDIVAHSLSVIVVQAEGGKALAEKRPERAGEVLGTIAEISREALAEMRQMVRLLRGEAGESDEDYVATPGLAEIETLIRRSGSAAELIETGVRPSVSSGLGLTAYRIVQESLTNVLKHAGPQARCWVRIDYTPWSIELEVTDDGRGAAVQGDGHGSGVRGMSERAAVHGGRLLAGPRAGGGFAVRATLPLEASPTDRGSAPPPSAQSERDG